MPKIIKIDFDGTIVVENWPHVGAPLPKAISTIKKLQKHGYHLILWTCREGEHLDNAVNFLKDKGIVFDAVNEGHPKNPFHRLGPGRKPYANYHLDDKNFGGFPGWEVIHDYFFKEKKYHLKKNQNEKV